MPSAQMNKELTVPLGEILRWGSQGIQRQMKIHIQVWICVPQREQRGLVLKSKSLNNGTEGSKKGRNHSMGKLGHVTSIKA